MLQLTAHVRFHFREQLKMQKNCEEKDAFYTAVYDPLDGAIKDA